MPVTAVALAEQPESMAEMGAPVLLGAAAAKEAFRTSTWAMASLARFASMPVVAASPMMAAERMAMMTARRKTRRLQPHTRRPLPDGGGYPEPKVRETALKGETAEDGDKGSGLGSGTSAYRFWWWRWWWRYC